MATFGLSPATKKYLSGFQVKGMGNRTPVQQAASKHYALNRLARTGYSGYGSAATAAMQQTPDTYVFNPDTGVASAGGGTTPTTTSPQDEAAMKLAAALRGQGVNWDYTAGQGYAPRASLIAGLPWRRIQNMPSLYQLLLDAAKASGTPQADYLAEIQQFQHVAPAYSTTSWGGGW